MSDDIEERIRKLEAEVAKNSDIMSKFENLGETLVRMDGRIERLVDLLSEAKVQGYPRCQDRDFRLTAVEKEIERFNKGESISFAFVKDDVKKLKEDVTSLTSKVDPLRTTITRWSAVIGFVQIVSISLLIPVILRVFYH